MEEVSIQASSLVAALGGAVTTAVIGNYLVQRWQRRNWFEQQRQLIHQQELTDLKALFDNLTKNADARLHAMRSLVDALEQITTRTIDLPLKEYQRQLATWNKSLRSYYPAITVHYGYATTLRLENEVHRGFFLVGQSLEQAVRLVRSGSNPDGAVLAQIRSRLNGQAGILSAFYQELANGLERRRAEILYGKRYRYLDGQLNQFTTSDLIKALFTPDVDSFDVVRPA